MVVPTLSLRIRHGQEVDTEERSFAALWMTAKNGVAPGKKARRNGSTTMASSAVG
jgi:hypothetical protein